MYPYLYVTKRGVILGLEELYRVKGTLGLQFTQFRVGIQLELLWAFQKGMFLFLAPLCINCDINREFLDSCDAFMQHRGFLADMFLFSL